MNKKTMIANQRLVDELWRNIFVDYIDGYNFPEQTQSEPWFYLIAFKKKYRRQTLLITSPASTFIKDHPRKIKKWARDIDPEMADSILECVGSYDVNNEEEDSPEHAFLYCFASELKELCHRTNLLICPEEMYFWICKIDYERNVQQTKDYLKWATRNHREELAEIQAKYAKIAKIKEASNG